MELLQYQLHFSEVQSLELLRHRKKKLKTIEYQQSFITIFIVQFFLLVFCFVLFFSCLTQKGRDACVFNTAQKTRQNWSVSFVEKKIKKSFINSKFDRKATSLSKSFRWSAFLKRFPKTMKKNLNSWEELQMLFLIVLTYGDSVY